VRSPLYISRDYGSTEGGEIRLAAGDTYPGAVIDLVGNGNEAILRFWNTNVNHVFEFNLTTGKFNFSGMTNKSSNGFTHCQGGIILQWGAVSTTARDTYITFPVTFGSVFSVVGSPITGSNLTGSQSNFAIKGLSNSGFYGNMYDKENGYAGFYWSAIGI